MKKIISILLVVGFALQAMSQTVFNFDALYNEKHDDAFAVMAKIIEDVRAQNGKPCVIQMSNKTYVFKKSENYGAFLALRNLKNLTIDGRGAKIRFPSYNNFCVGEYLENVVIKNFDFAHNKLAFTQGDIVELLEDSFVFLVDKGYPSLPTNEFIAKTYPNELWRWGSIMERSTRALKPNCSDHMFIEKVEKIGARKYRIFPKKNYMRVLGQIAVGDVWVMPVYKKRNPHFGGSDRYYTFSFTKSKDVLVENSKIAATKHAGFSASYNFGRITYKNCTLTWRNKKDMISSWRDGAHCKNNKIGPVFENCRFEGMLDDAINISAAPAFAIKKLGENLYQMCNFGFSVGDRIAVMDSKTGKWIDGLTALPKTEKNLINKKNILLFKSPIELSFWQNISQYDINSGDSRKNTMATQVFNMECINDGFVIRNCYFGVQRRFSFIVRAHNGVIENNVIEGGTGGIVSNEIGSWFEGPLPHNIVIKNNTFKTKIPHTPLIVGGMFPVKCKTDYDFNLKIYDNTIFYNPEKTKGMLITDCNNIKLSGNKFFDFSEKPKTQKEAIAISNATNVEIK